MKKNETVRPPPKLGIAITTMNRASVLRELLEAIEVYTSSSHVVVVCDDGSTDNTKDVVADAGAVYVTGARRGVAWNKNRGIYYLLNETSVSHLLLIDDDIRPTMFGWDEEWVGAIDRFGHVNHAHFTLDSFIMGPKNLSATCPGVTKVICGVCLGFSRRVIAAVGYMDNRFGLYGYEHGDLTQRAVRAGYGGFSDDELVYFVIRGGIETLVLPSSSTTEDLEFSAKHLLDEQRGASYIPPWHDLQQQEAFLAEVSVGNNQHLRFKLNDAAQYIASSPDVEQSPLGGVKHWLQFGQYEGRHWGS